MDRSLVALLGSILLSLANVSCQPESLPPAEPQTAAWDIDHLLKAQRSTNVPFVFVMVVDENTGRARDAAVSFQALQSAVAYEQDVSASEANELLRRQHTRRMVFRKPKALKQVWPRYSLTELEEVRRLLRDRTPTQIVTDQADLGSELNSRSRQAHGEPYGFLSCVLHVLLERGVSAGASCKPGLVYLAETTRGPGGDPEAGSGE